MTTSCAVIVRFVASTAMLVNEFLADVARSSKATAASVANAWITDSVDDPSNGGGVIDETPPTAPVPVTGQITYGLSFWNSVTAFLENVWIAVSTELDENGGGCRLPATCTPPAPAGQITYVLSFANSAKTLVTHVEIAASVDAPSNVGAVIVPP